MPKNNSTTGISINQARVNNLKSINTFIPHNQLTVITGVSGSGKSSLAFDTLFAEGQRRYIESLSSYIRQFLGKIEKPDVEDIINLPPAIAVKQKVLSGNPRSTVGTVTEIYEYFKLLFSRLGKTFSPISGKEVFRHTVSDIVENILKLPEQSACYVLVKPTIEIDFQDYLSNLLKQGFSGIVLNNEYTRIENIITNPPADKPETCYLVIDRFKVQYSDSFQKRISDSIETALYEGSGTCYIKDNNNNITYYSNKYEADGMEFEEPSIHFFSFNNPIGACPKCEGYGQTIGIDEDLVIPDKTLSVYQDGVACWKGDKMSKWKNDVIYNAEKIQFPIHKAYIDLTEKEKDLLWNGCSFFKGIYDFFDMLETKKYKIQYRVLLSRYHGKTRCPVCKGTRLKKETSYVKFHNKNIQELIELPVKKLLAFFSELQLTEYEKTVSKRILPEITNRLQYLTDVGLGYLTLNRTSNTLSGGESQRINLSSSLGNNLTGSLYILDEPSIGLHPKDTENLISILKKLRNQDNTVVVVEHDEEIMRASDYIIDIGPGAGRLGGEVVFAGKLSEINEDTKGVTGNYLSGKIEIELPEKRLSSNNNIILRSVLEHNLKGFDVEIPLNIITVVTGVSGSGKSTLIKDILFPALKNKLGEGGSKPGLHKSIEGDIHLLQDVLFIDQNPIGKSSRSNPTTYIKAYDDIRKLMSEQNTAKLNGYKPSRFSFNIEGGRCEVCQGEGEIKVEMQFMADIHLKCEACNGKKFKEDILDVTYKGKNIYDILEMTIEEAFTFFSQENKAINNRIALKLQALIDVGMGYVKCGQSSNTLSGGESQRIKLASFLCLDKLKPTLFIFDEPTTGLHFYDIEKLIKSFNALIRKGHSVVIIEHNPEIIKSADYIIDLGPEGGDEGGYLIYSGTPEGLAKNKKSYTGKYILSKLQTH